MTLYFIKQKDVEFEASNVPNLVKPNLDKVELETLRSDIRKFFRGSRVFDEDIKEEWNRQYQRYVHVLNFITQLYSV